MKGLEQGDTISTGQPFDIEYNSKLTESHMCLMWRSLVGEVIYTFKELKILTVILWSFQF